MGKNIIILLFLFICIAKSAVTYVSVLDYGAKADGGVTDNTKPFNDALKFAKQNNISRVYVPGAPNSYYHNKIIIVDGVLLYGDGYTSWLYANNSAATAVQLINQNSGVSNIRLTAIAQLRKSDPAQTQVWVYRAVNFLVNSVWVEPLPGTAYTYGDGDHQINGVGGIFVYGAQNGVVSNNFVNFTYADAIHVTSSSSDIYVKNNTIHNNGDDGLACVAYFPGMNKNITFTGNSVSNGKWGRGAGIIGCQNSVIEDNTILDVSGAGVWVASEYYYNTSANSNIIVRRNKIISSGYLAGNVCFGLNSLPGLGMNNGNANLPYFDRFQNIQFLDNYVSGTCNDVFRIDGSKVDDIVVAGNVFANSKNRMGVSLPATGGQLYFLGNRVENTTYFSVFSTGQPSILVFDSNNFVNPQILQDNNNTRTQVAYLGSAVNFQFTNNTYGETLPTNTRAFLQINEVTTSALIENNKVLVNRTLGTSDYSSLPTISLPTIKLDLNLTADSSIATYPSSTFAAGGSVTLLTAYGGVGGKVDTNFVRDSVTFTFSSGSSSGSFWFAVNNSAGVSIAQAKVTLINAAASTSGATSASTSEPSTTGSSTTSSPVASSSYSLSPFSVTLLAALALFFSF